MLRTRAPLGGDNISLIDLTGDNDQINELAKGEESGAGDHTVQWS